MDQRVRRILAYAIASAIISLAFHFMMRSSGGGTTHIDASKSRAGMSSDTAAMMDRLDDAASVSKEMGSDSAQSKEAKAASDMLKDLSR